MATIVGGKITVSGVVHLPNYVAPRDPGDYGVFMGGFNLTTSSKKLRISVTSSATNFGSLTQWTQEAAAASSGADGRVVMCGGIGAVPAWQSHTIIIYKQIESGPTSGSGTFGDLTYDRQRHVGMSNSINNRAVFTGGQTYAATNRYEAEYITISSTGNSLPYSTLGAMNDGAGTSNGTNDRGVFGTGATKYITISSLSSASNWNSGSRGSCSVASNSINDRALFCGGGTYLTAAILTTSLMNLGSLAGSVSFGDLTVARFESGAVSNGINERVVIVGGATDPANQSVDIIDYFTLTSQSNATDYGAVFTYASSAYGYADSGGT